jgi:hypothetical protein
LTEFQKIRLRSGTVLLTSTGRTWKTVRRRKKAELKPQCSGFAAGYQRNRKLLSTTFELRQKAEIKEQIVGTPAQSAVRQSHDGILSDSEVVNDSPPTSSMDNIFGKHKSSAESLYIATANPERRSQIWTRRSAVIVLIALVLAALALFSGHSPLLGRPYRQRPFYHNITEVQGVCIDVNNRTASFAGHIGLHGDSNDSPKRSFFW